VTEQPLVMNPFVDLHIHPAPEAYPIDVARIETITVACPVRGRGLLVHALTRAEQPALFGFFLGLVARDGELALDSDAPLVPELAAIGFLVVDDEIVEWPQLAVPLPEAPDDAVAPGPGWRVASTFLFQPAFALHPGVRWPADYQEQDGRMRCFAPGPAFWLGEPAALVEAFWVTAEAAGVLSGLVPGEPPPAMPPALARALAHAGALVVPGSERPSPLARFAGLRAGFEADGYAIVRGLLGAGELAALRRYYAALLAAGLVQLGDRQNAARYSAYNDPVGRFVQARLAGAMSVLAGQPVEPAFSFFFSYLEGAALAPHKDRAQAEYSISLQLDHVPEPAARTGWPLRFSFDDEREVAADLGLGDAVLYHGRSLSHHRTALPTGQRSSLLVLEYVPHDFRGLRI